MEKLRLTTYLVLEKVIEENGELSAQAEFVWHEMFKEDLKRIFKWYFGLDGFMDAVKSGSKIKTLRYVYYPEDMEFLENNFDHLDEAMEILKELINEVGNEGKSK